jgi:hypothetical protein
VMDGAHTHSHGPGPSGLAELAALGLGIAVAAEVLARVLTFLLIGLAIAAGVLAVGAIGYVVAACRRYQQQTTWTGAAHYPGPVLPDDPARPVLADPVPLRQAITELHAQLLATRAGLPMTGGTHQHLHLHGLTPEQAAAIITELQAQQHPHRWEDGGSQ